jgi:hypothetical protein
MASARKRRMFEGGMFEVASSNYDDPNEFVVATFVNEDGKVENTVMDKEKANFKVYLKVVGFRDPLDPSQDWGIRSLA